MKVQEVHIPPTRTTPEILLAPQGIINIKGRAIDESRSRAPDEVLDWVDAYLSHPAELTRVSIALEFLNSFNTMILTALLKKISGVIKQEKKLDIKWYYEEDDTDIFERGEYISSVIGVPIEFILTDRVMDN